MRAHRMKRRIATIASIFATMLGADDALAWTGLDLPPYPVWGKLPVAYSINLGTFPPAISATLEQRALDSFASWSAPECTTFQTVFLGDSASGSYNMSDGKNILLWINSPDPWPSELGDTNSVIGVTLPVWEPDAQGNPIIYDADIVFNNIGFCWYDAILGPPPDCGNQKPVDAQSILTHEIGHFLGLGHTDEVGATMQAFYDGGNDLATLEQDDIVGVCALYPIESSSSSSGGGNGTCESCRDNAANGVCLAQTDSCGSQCGSLCVCLSDCRMKDPAEYDACATDCSRNFPDGTKPYLDYVNCICNVCAQACGAECSANLNGDECGPLGASSGSHTEPVLLTGSGACTYAMSQNERRACTIALAAFALFGAMRKRKRNA